jgi:glucuronate isomerase
LLEEFGTDAGTDSIGDRPQAERMSRFLDKLDQENSLPKTIVYNVNPADNYTVATMLGNFQRDIPGKMQFGSGWWHLDQRDGMAEQMKTLANVGLLSRFVGMLTDSRSFLSFPRHEYFRRILCNLLGEWMEEGFIPDDIELVGNLAKRICFGNAKEFLRLGDSS